MVFRAKGARQLAEGLYLSEQPGNVNPADDGVVVPQHDPAIHRSIPSWSGTKGPGEHPQYGGWGGAQADRSPFGEPLRVAGQRYDTGIGVLANSRLEVVNKGYARFTASTGVDDAAVERAAEVVFEVYGDGRLLAKSPPRRFGQSVGTLSADVRDVKLIELIVRRLDGRDPGAPLPVVWANAALTR